MQTHRTETKYQDRRSARRWPAVAALWAASLLLYSAQAAAAKSPWVDERLSPAEIEAAYGGAGDAIELSQVCDLLLQITNEDREEAGPDDVQWSDLAAQVAQTQADEMVERRLVGHYDAAGRTCELRFNLAGGTDQIVENTVYYEIQHDVYLTAQLVRRVQEHWLASTSHRRNILDPAHTHFGAGFAVRRLDGVSRVAAVAEFVNDYGDYAPLPLQATRGDTVEVAGSLDPRRAELRYLGIGVTDPPQPIASGQRQRAGYDQPKVVLGLVPRRLPAQVARGIEFVRYGVDYDSHTGEFAAQVWLDPDWPAAAYHFTVWVARPGVDEQPFRAMTQVVLVE